MKIASGVAPIERLRTEGVNCTVGTDGPSSNNDLDMWEEMRNASFLQKVTTMDPCAVPAYELLRMATVCGAAAIGHAGELGVVKEGALADLVLLSTQRPYYHPQHDVVANVAYCAKAADVDTVVVDGEVVVDGGRLSTVDRRRSMPGPGRRAADRRRVVGYVNREGAGFRRNPAPLFRSVSGRCPVGRRPRLGGGSLRGRRDSSRVRDAARRRIRRRRVRPSAG